MESYTPQGSVEATSRGHEWAGINVRVIVGTAALLIALLGIVHVVLTSALGALGRERRDARAASPGFGLFAGDRQEPPSPRLQTDPMDDIARLKTAQLAWLHSVGWADGSHATVHVPIEQAKMLLLQRGLPHVGTLSAPALTHVPSQKAVADAH